MTGTPRGASLGDDGAIVLGVRFFVGSVADAVDRTLAGGLVTAPSAPGLAEIDRDGAYREALEHSDTVLTDSGFMVLAWRALGHRTLPRISGLAYLEEMLTRRAWREARCLWVVPSAAIGERQRAWLAGRGIDCPPGQIYVAPEYDGAAIEDPTLLAHCEVERPDHVMVGVGGGRQEQLGWYLRQRLGYRPGIHCTGAAIAFLTGEQVRIPRWADRLFLGWLARIAVSPARYAGRYARALRLLVLLARHGERSPAGRNRGAP